MQTTLTIFILEDEVLIRMMVAEMLEELGHRVVAETGSVPEARSLAASVEFDLALLDINIKGDTSADIAAIIEKRGLPLIFVSGYTTTGLPAPFQDRRVLRKPFPVEALKRSIEHAMAGASRGSI